MADLKKIFGEELYNQVTEKLGENKIDVVSDGSYIAKNKFDEINAQNETYKTQVGTLNGQIKDLEKSAGGDKDLLTKIETMKGDNEALNGKIKDITIKNAIKMALIESKAKYPDLLAKEIDISKCNVDEAGNTTGIKEQLPSLQENYKDFFEAEIPGNGGGNPPGATNSNVPNLDEEYQNALKSGNLPLAISIKNKLFDKK
ncbi:MAG: Phage minor structural protein [Anaerocolumna sp.]|jgi:hypothetical protein|nr:Phage minor structural protein [Anaerocolumna sp.]